MSVNKPALKILIVDDDPADAELEMAALRHDFQVSDWRRVETRPAFVAALENGAPDLILCDDAMPCFSGMEALSIWQAAGAMIPFIFVTGRLSEEVAVDCIKAGATDYVLKGNLTRLPEAVRRALRESAAAHELRQLEAERSRIAAAVEQTEEAVLITNPDGVIVYVNPAFTKINGYESEEAIGQTPRLLRSDVQDASFYADMWRKITAGHVWRGQLVNRRRDGRFYDAEMVITPVFDAASKLVNFCAIQRDITERVAAERHLLDLNARLAETDRLKDEFLAAFSHELRTPLNIIVGYADILGETLASHVDSEALLSIHSIARSADQLTALINNTLDLARLRIDEIKPHFVGVDARVLVQELIEQFRPLATRKGLDLSYVSSSPCTIMTDATRLRQILSNLIDNAIKFTERGEVSIHINGEADGFSAEVRDTGIGISAADIPHIFEDFRQLDGSATRLYGGCGLGLSIVKRLVELLGGDIVVESEAGQGTRFCVRLPQTSSTEVLAKQRPSSERIH